MKTNQKKFGSIKQMLTRDEMRKVKGGSGWYICACSGEYGPCISNCTFMSDNQIALCLGNRWGSCIGESSCYLQSC